MNEEEDKRKSEILAVLFGAIFLMIFIYSLVRLVCRIKLEYEKTRINRRNRRLLALTNSMELN